MEASEQVTRKVHPVGNRVLVAPVPDERPPVLYVPIGVQRDTLPDRGMVVEVSDDVEGTLPYGAGDVVMYVPGHGMPVGDDMKLIDVPYVLAWESD